ATPASFPRERHKRQHVRATRAVWSAPNVGADQSPSRTGSTRGTCRLCSSGASRPGDTVPEMHHDDHRSALARREVLALLGATAGSGVVGRFLFSPVRGRPGGSVFGAATAVAADPSCVVRSEMTEGPFFVDERLNRSDIRSDPSDGSIRPGVTLALAFVVS